MQFRITTGSHAAIYRQITDQIRRGVASGELGVGDALPSVRQLARDLLVNPNTVSKAYSELVRDGVLDSQPGRGFYIAKRRTILTKHERLRRLDDALDSALVEIVALDLSVDEVVDRLRHKLERIMAPKGS